MASIRPKGKPHVADSPDPIDLLVAKRLRQRRVFLEMSQGELAKRVKLSWQQIQKYEHGRNRISASMLYKFARVLDVDVNWFFDLDRSPEHKPETMATDERQLLQAYRGLVKPAERRRALTIVKTLRAS